MATVKVEEVTFYRFKLPLWQKFVASSFHIPALKEFQKNLVTKIILQTRFLRVPGFTANARSLRIKTSNCVINVQEQAKARLVDH